MHIIIPNDPTKSDPREDNGDFSKRLEINHYCPNLKNDVLNLIEKVYPSLEPKIRHRYRNDQYSYLHQRKRV